MFVDSLYVYHIKC